MNLRVKAFFPLALQINEWERNSIVSSAQKESKNELIFDQT